MARAAARVHGPVAVTAADPMSDHQNVFGTTDDAVADVSARSGPPTEDVALSLIVPAYNEEARLADTLATLAEHFETAGISYEIMVVDDGSTDRTVSVARDVARAWPRVRVILADHRGKGHAVRVGVLSARGRSVAFCDADLPVPPSDISQIVARLDAFPVVIGSREVGHAERIGEPYSRHLMGRLFNALVRALALPGLQDTQCGVKAFTAECARAIFSRQLIDGFGFDVETLYLARRDGYVIHEEPVTWSYRALSRVDPRRDALRMIGDILRVRWRDALGAYGSRTQTRSADVAAGIPPVSR